jgi:hypothetical protein
MRLADGREVVLKMRPPAERIATCISVQRYAWEHGFPCPEPLTGPHPLGDLAATAEAYVRGSEPLVSPDAPELFARGLAALVSTVPLEAARGTLEPVPYWMAWDHALAGTWPPDPNVDLNGRAGPEGLERAGQIARERLRDLSGFPSVIGHADWESQNIGWRGRDLHVVHDWDSVVRRPESTIAGMSSVIFPSTGPRNEAATIAESESFLDAYQAARRPFSVSELAAAWATGLWIGAWKAKKALLHGDRNVWDRLAPEVDERIRRAGG